MRKKTGKTLLSGCIPLSGAISTSLSQGGKTEPANKMMTRQNISSNELLKLHIYKNANCIIKDALGGNLGFSD